jgi:hypothetical protein
VPLVVEVELVDEVPPVVFVVVLVLLEAVELFPVVLVDAV